MFDVTSKTRDNTSVIILKSRLTLQVILPARTSLVTPSLIDDSVILQMNPLQKYTPVKIYTDNQGAIYTFSKPCTLIKV